MKVVYGHTDSIYVKIDSIDKAKQAVEEINSHVRKAFPNILGLAEHPVNLEFEKYFSSLGVGATKNRNAGLISWKDGYPLDTPEFTMTGFTAKRISENVLGRDIQISTLKMWLDGKSQKTINSYLYEKYRSVINGKISINSIIKRSRLKVERFEVKCQSCNKKYKIENCYPIQFCEKCGKGKNTFVTTKGKKPTFGEGVAGILYGREKLDMQYDDSYLYMKIQSNDRFTHPLTDESKQVEYYAGSTYEDFDNVTPDWRHYANQVIKKAEPIYKAMGWNTDSIRTGTIQTSFEDWW